MILGNSWLCAASRKDVNLFRTSAPLPTAALQFPMVLLPSRLASATVLKTLRRPAYLSIQAAIIRPPKSNPLFGMKFLMWGSQAETTLTEPFAPNKACSARYR